MVKKETKKIKITDVRGNTYDGKRKKKGKITLQADRKKEPTKKKETNTTPNVHGKKTGEPTKLRAILGILKKVGRNTLFFNIILIIIYIYYY